MPPSNSISYTLFTLFNQFYFMFLLQVTMAIFKVARFGAKSKPELITNLMESLQRMENDLKARGTPYYSGRAMK